VAHYRAGDCKAAVSALEKSIEIRARPDPLAGLYLAMARYQLGEKDRARECYDRSVSDLTKDPRRYGDLRHLHQEAAALLERDVRLRAYPEKGSDPFVRDEKLGQEADPRESDPFSG